MLVTGAVVVLGIGISVVVILAAPDRTDQVVIRRSPVDVEEKIEVLGTIGEEGEGGAAQEFPRSLWGPARLTEEEFALEKMKAKGYRDVEKMRFRSKRIDMELVREKEEEEEILSEFFVPFGKGDPDAEEPVEMPVPEGGLPEEMPDEEPF
jgi:hypothetical protein